jgi:hypothetical protein
MAQLSFALLAVHDIGLSVATLAEKLSLPEDIARERVEAARLCFMSANPAVND